MHSAESQQRRKVPPQPAVHLDDYSLAWLIAGVRVKREDVVLHVEEELGIIHPSLGIACPGAVPIPLLFTTKFANDGVGMLEGLDVDLHRLVRLRFRRKLEVRRKRLSCCSGACDHCGGQGSLGGASARHWKAWVIKVDSWTPASLTFAAVERETRLIEIEDVLELLRLDLDLARQLVFVGKPELEKGFGPCVEPTIEVFKGVPENSPVLDSLALGCKQIDCSLLENVVKKRAVWVLLAKD